MVINGFEKAKFEDDEIIVDDVTVTYHQNEDCAAEDIDGTQTITLSTANNGSGRFIRIKTNNWAITDENDMVDLIKDFIKRASITDATE